MVPLHLSYPSCYLHFTSSAWATPTSSPNGVAAIPPLSTQEVLAPLQFNSKEEYVPSSLFCFLLHPVCYIASQTHYTCLLHCFTKLFCLFLNRSSNTPMFSFTYLLPFHWDSKSSKRQSNSIHVLGNVFFTQTHYTFFLC